MSKTDDEIARAITLSCALGVTFSALRRDAVAQQFIGRALRLMASNVEACKRWMKAREAHG